MCGERGEGLVLQRRGDWQTSGFTMSLGGETLTVRGGSLSSLLERALEVRGWFWEGGGTGHPQCQEHTRVIDGELLTSTQHPGFH